MSTVLKSGNRNLLEPCGPVQACNGIALPLPLPFTYLFVPLCTSYPEDWRSESEGRHLPVGTSFMCVISVLNQLLSKIVYNP